nr:hypothetical protein [Tanacetum cinerariifolium]
MEQMTTLTSICEMVCQIFQKKQEEKRIEEEQAANARYWKIPACCDDDDDYDSAITPVLSTEEPVNSLSMGDEHLDKISVTESDEVIKSSVEDLVPILSESEGENGCDMPSCFTTFSNILFDVDYDFKYVDDQSLHNEDDEFIKSSVENLVPNPSESKGENGGDLLACFTTFSNIIFDDEYEFDSADDQSLYNEDFSEKIFSNPLFEEEINSIKKNQHHFNVESDLVESLLNHDSSIIPSSSKIDSRLDEFAGELTLRKSIPPGIDETDYHPENEIRLSQRLLYDNSSPRPPEEFVSDDSNADIESFSPSPIIEEIDLTFTPDDPMPPSIKEDDDDSRDTLIREKLFDNYSLSIPENESFHFDIPLSSRPPAKPLDDQEKSPDLLSHRGFEIFQPSAECPMKIHGKNIPTLDVPCFHFYPLDQLKCGGN